MKARGWALLICLLLALPSWGAKWYMGTATAGDSVASLTAFLAASSSGDSLIWRSNHTSPINNEAVTVSSVGPRHFIGNGYTETIIGTATHWVRLATGTGGSKITGLRILHATGGRTTGIIYCTGADADYTLTDVDIVAPTGGGFYATSIGDVVFDGCDFQCTAGTAIIVDTASTSFTMTDCAVHDGATGASFKTTDGLVEDCTFSLITTYAIALAAGPTDVTGCTFTRCGQGVRNSTTATGYSTVQHCTFTRCLPYAVNVEGDGDSLLIAYNLFGEQSSKIFHLLMLGRDGGNDIGAVFNVRCRNNTFSISATNDTLTLEGAMLHAVKCKGAKIYNNTAYLARAFTPQGVMRDFGFVTLKGGQQDSVWNNRIDIPYITAFKYNLQVTTGDKLSFIANNHVTPRCLYFMRALHDSLVHGRDNHQWLANCTGGLDGYSEQYARTFDLDTLADWSTTNFADSTSWKLKWGGKTNLPGVTYSAQGFINVGVNTGSVGQPAISRHEPGFRTPIESLESIRAIGALKGVELEAYIINDQDRANLKVWQFGPHAVGNGTNQQIGNDTLRVQAAFQ